MKRTTFLIAVCIMALTSAAQMAQATKDILKTNVNNITLWLDGKQMPGGWGVLYGDKVDPLSTRAKKIVFASDIDTLTFTLEKTWQSKDFTIVSTKGEKAPVRVTRISDNVFEDPNPELLKRTTNGLLSREQAEFDIDALVYTISEIHPDMFSVCKQEDFFRAVNKAKETLPDSVSTLELYRRIAPIVAMIGDGHTNLGFPHKDVFKKELKRMPLQVNVHSDKSVICRSSLDSIIPRGARIVSINGVNAEEMVNSMLPYVSGEKEPFRIARIDYDFPALRHALYPADSFKVVYLPAGEKKPREATYPATSIDEIVKRCPAVSRPNTKVPYSLTTDKKRNLAIMDFLSFDDKPRMEAFADSMFKELNKQRIDNLIIDLRQNGGGNSAVGDVLLRYISPVPFIQMEKGLVRISPLTRKLMRGGVMDLGFSFFEKKEDQYVKPLTQQEGHYDGHVYLLTSNITFSSASSFSWVFKECRMGTVIGEETGGMNVSYGDILVYRLPASRLTCTISYKRFWLFHADERSIHGTIPDIAVPAADALEAALKAIKSRK